MIDPGDVCTAAIEIDRYVRDKQDNDFRGVDKVVKALEQKYKRPTEDIPIRHFSVTLGWKPYLARGLSEGYGRPIDTAFELDQAVSDFYGALVLFRFLNDEQLKELLNVCTKVSHAMMIHREKEWDASWHGRLPPRSPYHI